MLCTEIQKFLLALKADFVDTALPGQAKELGCSADDSNFDGQQPSEEGEDDRPCV